MARQNQVPHDQIGLRRRDSQVASHHGNIVGNAREATRTVIVAKLEVGHVDRHATVQQLESQGRSVKVRLPHDRWQVVTRGHGIQDRRNMNGRFTSDPLEIASTLSLPPRDGLRQELRRQQPTARRIEGIGLRNAERAAQIAPRQVEQMRRHQFRLLATLDAMSKHARFNAGMTRPTLALRPVGPATVFAQLTVFPLVASQLRTQRCKRHDRHDERMVSCEQGEAERRSSTVRKPSYSQTVMAPVRMSSRIHNRRGWATSSSLAPPESADLRGQDTDADRTISKIKSRIDSTRDDP